MSYDLFISYAHADNEGEHTGKVTALVGAIRDSYRKFAGEVMRDFFDVESLPPGANWELRLTGGLRQSRMMLAVLSPNYFASAYCRKEWEYYVETEMAQALPGDGITPIYVVGHPDFDGDTLQAELREWARDLKRRQFIEWREFWPEGALALEREDVRRRLEELPKQIAQRLKHAETRDRSPNTIPLPSEHFVGRRAELHRLREQLVRGQIGAITAVHGIPGIGKSMLAFAYAWGYGHEYPGGRFLIRAAGLPDLATGTCSLADAKRVPLTDDERKQPEVVLAKVKAAFEQGEPALLLIDNVDDANLLSASSRELALPRGDHIHVLVTTRVSPEHLPRIQCLPLDRLTTDDGRALLNSLRPIADMPQDDEWKAAGQIVQRLGGHALMVEVVAVYLRDHPDVSCRRFYEYLEREGIELLDREVATRVDPNALVSHTETCLTRLLEPTLQSLTPEELRAVEYAALLPPDVVPLLWLRELLRSDFPHLALKSLSDPTREVLQRLEKLWLLVPLGEKRQHVPDFLSKETPSRPNATKLARMHRLVQEVVVRRAGSREREDDLRQKVTNHAKARCKFLETRWLDWANRWEVDALAALSNQMLVKVDGGATEIARSIALRLLDLARHTEAERLMRRALAIDEQAYGSHHPDVASDLNNLAMLLRVTNRLAEAEPLMRRALVIDEAWYGPEDRKVATDLSNLAALLEDSNQPAEAEPLMRRALSIDEEFSGPNHTDVARDLNNLACLLHSTNRLAEAEPLMRRALAIDAQWHGSDHPEVARHLNNLAMLLEDTNRFVEAEPLVRRALASNEQFHGPAHLNVARNVNNLACLLFRTNRLAEAESLMRRVLAIDEQWYGSDHPDVARDLNNLAQLLQQMNRPEEAEPLMRRALAIDEVSYAPNHSAVACDLSNLASLLLATNRLAEAEPLMRRALAISEQSYGPNHPDVAIRLNNLAQLLQATNRLAEAEPLMRRALAIDEQSYGPNHPDVAIRLNNLAQLLQATNRLAEAEPLMRRALAIDELSYGANHPVVAIRLNNLAQLHQATNRLAEAEPLMRRAVEISESSLGIDHPNTVRRRDIYAVLRTQMGLDPT